MNCPKCGEILRQSEKYPGCALCDNCKIRYKLPKKDEYEELVEPADSPKKKDRIGFVVGLVSFIILIHFGFWVVVLYCLL